MTGRGLADPIYFWLLIQNFQNSDVFGKLTLKNNEMSLKDFLPELTIHKERLYLVKINLSSWI